MIDKKEPVEPSNLDAAPGPDNALKDSDAHDDAGLHDKLQSPMKQDSDAQVQDKLQSPVEEDSDARDDVGLQDKLQSPAEQVPNWMEGLTPEVRMRVQRLQKIQRQQNKLENKLLEKRRALEDKYENLLKLQYDKRSKIVNGEVDVKSNTYETAEEATLDEKATKVKGIPDFWLTAMKNNETLALTIKSHDEEALKYLKDIKYCTFGHPLNLKLEFFFDTNPFFKNSILTRTYMRIEDLGEITEAQSTGTEINWFPKKCLTHEINTYNQKGRAKRETITEELDSFFNFFGNSEDGDIGSILYDEIIPKAVSWYTGEAPKDEIESGAQEDSHNESSEEEEFDDSDSESSEEESSEEEEFDDSDSESSEEEEFDEDENESDGEASKKRTRVEGSDLLNGRAKAHKSGRIRSFEW